jgi:hypothetical protein
MTRSADHQICFRLPDAAPAASPAGPLRLGDTQAEAFSELLQVFACGEESAALAFAHLGGSAVEDAARHGLARIAEEEVIHERLLRGLRAALPAPAPDRELRRALLRFYHGVAQPDIGLHFAAIAALASAVCVILATLLEPDRVLAREPEIATILGRIHRDEGGHVRLSRRLARGGQAELQLYEGASHGFMTGKPDAPYAARAIERMKQFIRRHTTG